MPAWALINVRFTPADLIRGAQQVSVVKLSSVKDKVVAAEVVETIRGKVRVVNALERIVQKHDKPEDAVAMVCHSDPIKLAVAPYVGLPLDHVQRPGCDTGSLTALRIHATGAQLVKLDQHPPFEFLPQDKHMYGMPDTAILERLVQQTARYFREREEIVREEN